MATQQEINDFVEQIMPYFDPTPVEDDAVQQSYPRLDRGLSDAQDMTRFQHLKGIFARGGRPYWLRAHGTNAETDERRTLFLTVSTITGVAEAAMHGAFHRLREDIELSFPAVSTPTTQYVVLEYDPIRSEGGGDPIEAKVVTSLDTSQGKDYLVLWEVDRRPSQLLSAAPRKKVRPFAGSVVSVNYFDELPDPGTLLLGTLGLVREDRTWWYAYTPIEGGWSDDAGPYWMPLTSPRWEERVTNTFEGVDGAHAPHSSLTGGRVSVRGTLRIRSGASFQVREAGYWLITLPDAHCPPRTMNFITATSRQSPLGYARVRVDPSGEVRAWVDSQAAWLSLDGVEYWVD